MRYLKCVVSVLAIICLAGPAYSEEAAFEVVGTSGAVTVLPAGEAEYEAAEEDMFVQAGDALEVGEDSYVELAYDEEGENIVRVNANSSAVITLRETEKIELLEGEILATINSLPEGSTFEIRTPTSVSGVRGTDWLTKVDEEGTDIEVVEGKPYIKGIQEDGTVMATEMIVAPGYKTRVKRYQRPSVPVRLPPERYKKLHELKTNMHKRAKGVIHKRKQMHNLHRRMDRMHGYKERRMEKKRHLPPPEAKDGPGPAGKRGVPEPTFISRPEKPATSDAPAPRPKYQRGGKRAGGRRAATQTYKSRDGKIGPVRKTGPKRKITKQKKAIIHPSTTTSTTSDEDGAATIREPVPKPKPALRRQYESNR